MPAAQSPAVGACLSRLAAASCVQATAVAQRDNSRIHRVSCVSGAIAVKECLGAARTPDRAGAEREFAALTLLRDTAERAGEAPLAPEPLALCAEHGAYAMTWADGRSATEAVLDRATTREEAAALGAAAGDWLRRFHALQGGPARGHDFGDRLAYAAGLAAAAPRDAMLARTLATLTRTAAAAAAVDMPVSWVHGDMKSDNLMVAPGRVTGLDVQLADRNTVVYDLAPFLNHLALLQGSPRGALARGRLAAMAEAFLRAYSPQTTRWELPIMWLRGYFLMQVVAAAAGRGVLRGAVTRFTARRQLARVLDALETRR